MNISSLLHDMPYPFSGLLQEIANKEHNYDDAISSFHFLEVSFATTRFLNFILLALYTEHDFSQNAETSKYNRYILNSLQKPSEGTWFALLEYSIKNLKFQKEHFFSADICNIVNQETNNKKNLLQILKESVSIRNSLVHRNQNTNENQIQQQLKKLLIEFSHLWELLVDYKLLAKNSDGKYIMLKGLPPFSEYTQEIKGNGNVYLMKDDATVCLDPWLYFDNEYLYFYNKKHAQNFYFVSYGQGGQTKAQQLQKTLSSQFMRIWQHLEQNAIPEYQNTSKEIVLDFSHLCEFHNDNFVGREDVQQKIMLFVRESSDYGIITGEAGIGKTALLASIYNQNKQFPLKEQYVWHFCAHTEGRDNPQIFFRSLLAQAYKKFPDLQKDIPFEIQSLSLLWQQCLMRISQQLNPGEKFVFVIDALDESLNLENPQESIPYLLPKKLPGGILGIITIREDILPILPIKELHNTHFLHKLEKLQQKDIESLLIEKLKIEQSMVTPQIMERIWKNSQQGDPFYLRFMADALRNRSLSLQNISLIPDNLESFFQETWLTLPTDEDFLAHRILGLLAVLQVSGDDEKLAEILGRSGDAIARIRVQLNKLLVMSKESYSIFHQKFRDYVIDKFTSKDLADFHRLIVKYYDTKDIDGNRQIEEFSEEALRYVFYHAYQAGQMDGNNQTLYELVEDSQLQQRKKGVLKATQFILDDISYAIKCLSKQAFTDETYFISLLRYTWKFNEIIEDSRAQIPQMVASYIKEEKYDLALSEIQLIVKEEQRFYQFLMLSIAAMVNEQKMDEIIYIMEALKTLPVPSLSYRNISLYTTFVIECLEYSYHDIYDVLPWNTNIDFWQPIIKKAVKEGQNNDFIYNLIVHQKLDENFIVEVFTDIPITITTDSPWYQFFQKKIKSTYLFAKILLEHTSDEEILEEVTSYLPEITDTREKATIIQQILKRTSEDSKNLLNKIIYYSEQIEDEAVKLHILCEIFVHQKKNYGDYISFFQEWLANSKSPTKKFRLETYILVCSATPENIEDVWLQLDQQVQDLGINKDSKEVRKLIDIAKALQLLDNKEISQDIATKITAETYKILDTTLRVEASSEIGLAFSEAALLSSAKELCEQVLYTSKGIFPWEKRCDYLNKALNIMDHLDDHRDYLYSIFIEECLLFSLAEREKVYKFLLPKITLTAKNLFVFEEFVKKEKYFNSITCYYLCKWLSLSSEIDVEAQLKNLQEKVLSCEGNDIKGSSLSHLAQVLQQTGNKTLCIEWLLKGQSYLIDRSANHIHCYSAYACASKLDKSYQEKLVPYLQNKEQSHISWKALVFATLLEKDVKKASDYCAKSVRLLLEIPDYKTKQASMYLWLQKLSPIKDLGKYKSAFSIFEDMICNLESDKEKSRLFIEFAKVLTTLEKAKETKQFFHHLQSLVAENIIDSVYQGHTILRICQYISREFREEAQIYIDKIWNYVKENQDNFLVTSALLRNLRSFGSSKLIKEHIEPIMNAVDSEKNLQVKGRILKDILSALTGIETITRLQKILAKLLQTISQLNDIHEQRRRLVDLTGMFPKLEEQVHMEEVWGYLERINGIIESIPDTYVKAQTQVQIAKKIGNHHPESAQDFLAKAQNTLSKLTEPYQKSDLLAQIVFIYKDKQNYEECLLALETIPIHQRKVDILLEILLDIPYEWQLKMILVAAYDEDTLDELFGKIITQNNYAPEIVLKVYNQLVSDVV